MVLLLSKFLLGINPFSKEFHVIRLMSIIVIIFILYYNTKQITIATAIILPLSINKITYSTDLIDSYQIESNMKTEVYYLLNVKETSDFLSNLEENANYFVNIEFIPDFPLLEEDVPKMFLSKPFLINRFSSSELITKFI
jgi:hypothetical protein